MTNTALTGATSGARPDSARPVNDIDGGQQIVG